MQLKFKVTAEEWQGLGEGIKGLYEEKDGAYLLSIEGFDDTAGLKSALEKERANATNADKRAKAFEKFGKSPEELSELLRKIEKEELEKAEKSGEWDKLKAQMNEQAKIIAKNPTLADRLRKEAAAS